MLQTGKKQSPLVSLVANVMQKTFLCVFPVMPRASNCAREADVLAFDQCTQGTSWANLRQVFDVHDFLHLFPGARWTDFGSACTDKRAEPSANLLRWLNENRTLLLLGDSVLGQVYGFAACWMLSAHGHAASGLTPKSRTWVARWQTALRAVT